ncbi:MAG: hypothetical protein WBE90_03765 [Xanthobacteraceae bacterium]|jgi:hypothetical protein
MNYTAEAEACERLAETAKDPNAKAAYLELVKGWRAMARELDPRKRDERQ